MFVFVRVCSNGDVLDLDWACCYCGYSAGSETRLPLVIDELQFVLGGGQGGLDAADLQPGQRRGVAVGER